MSHPWAFSLVALANLLPGLGAQSQDESFAVYTEHPRIFLGARRLRLLQRERERQSLRWQQFATLVAGKASMPEPGFAYALYYRASGDAAVGRQAVKWALGSPADPRQQALVFDWCQDLLEPAQADALAARLRRSLETAGPLRGASAARDRMLAAVALAERFPDLAARRAREIVRGWWGSRIVPGLRSGKEEIPRDDTYALFELFHVVRDTWDLDLRDAVPALFKDLPVYQLLSYYPATYPAGENDYRIPISPRTGEPDLRRAALSRAAELSTVAYDVNAPETQSLQGWLLHDRFLMRSPFGIPYEFLWANPYQPGLSYYHLPLFYHDEHFGRLFARSSWDEDASWLGYFGGHLQLFQDGRVTALNPLVTSGPLTIGSVVVWMGSHAAKFRLTLKPDERVFVLGLQPRRTYEIEVDQEEMREERTDSGGILALDLPPGREVGVRLRESVLK